MEIPLKQLLTTLDDCIRRGNATLARSELEKLDLARVPRSFVAPLAAVARRAGLPRYALILLHPYVREPRSEPSVQESAEYAAALTFLGGADEALEILSPLNPEKTPECLLYLAFAHFARWEYTQAIPQLLRYSKVRELTRYQRLVGKLNLASALVYERADNVADQLISELLEEVSYPGFEFLRSSVLEVAAQFYITEKRWLTAQKLLIEARAAVRQAAGLQDLFVKKWRAILDLKRSPVTPALLQTLVNVRKEAVAGGHYETIRDCDRFLAIASQDEALLQYVYFGTPLESFRRRVLSDFGRPISLPKEYAWLLNGGAGSSFDPLAQNWPAECTRLFLLLCRDFYRPSRVPALYFKLFHGEPYHPGDSDAKVVGAITQLKNELQRLSIPLDVLVEGDSVRIAARESITIHLPDSEQIASEQAA